MRNAIAAGLLGVVLFTTTSCSIESFCSRTQQVATTSARVLQVAGFPGELANAAVLKPIFDAVCEVARCFGRAYDGVLSLFIDEEPESDTTETPPGATSRPAR